MGVDHDAKRSKTARSRDPGPFVALPHSVLKSAAYLGLSANARSLLIEVALQFRGDDNGRMLLSRAHLKKRGWASSDMIDKGKRELLNAELIFETVKGHRPNKASWYAVTWHKLNKLDGYDHGVEKAFEQGAYKRGAPVADAAMLKGYGKVKGGTRSPSSGAALSPQGGTRTVRNDPPHGTGIPPPVPPRGPIRGVPDASPVPPIGHPLEKPSAGVRLGSGSPSWATSLA